MPLTEEQMQARSQGIGSSDSGVIAHVNPYKTEYQLYLEKRGEIPRDPIENEAMYWGNVLEDPVAKVWAERNGVKIHKVNKTIRHPEYPFILAHMDRGIYLKNEALEVKTAAIHMTQHWGPNGSDQVPEEYQCQVHHVMMIKPKIEVMNLAVLIGGRDFRQYRIPRDQTLIDGLMELEIRFWHGVQNGIPPEIEFSHPSMSKLISLMYPGTDGTIVDLPPIATAYHQVKVDAAARETEFRKLKEGAANQLKFMAKNAAIIRIPEVEGEYRRKVIKRKSYTVEPEPYVDFRFSKKVST